MQNKQNYTTCLYIGPCKAQKDKAKNALDKARVFSILCLLSMCSRSLNSSPKSPRPSNNLARVLNKLLTQMHKAQAKSAPLHQRILSCVQIKSAHSCVQKDGAQSISLFKKPSFKSKRHSESLYFKCSSQSSRTKP